VDGRAGGGDRQRRCAMNELAHIPAPSDATWVGEWEFFEDCWGNQDWERVFGLRSWTIETTSTPSIEVELAGVQLSEGCIVDIWIWIHGDIGSLTAGEATTLAATLSRAAGELERIRWQPVSTRDQAVRRTPTRPLHNPMVDDSGKQGSQEWWDAVGAVPQCGDTRPCPDCNAFFRFCSRDGGVWTREANHDQGCRWPATGHDAGVTWA
jgi:hypothetical protein